MNHDHLFAFESDFVATLRCVPMAVRFKLDRIGVKLTLKQWSRFTQSDRRDLLTMACVTSAEIAAYKARVLELVTLRTGEQAAGLPEPVVPVWEVVDAIPEAVTAFARLKGIRTPDIEDWAEFSELERFVLVKLSRDNHDNVNFIPALREFGFLPDEAAVRTAG